MRTLGVVGSLLSLMHTLGFFGSPSVMLADVWLEERAASLLFWPAYYFCCTPTPGGIFNPKAPL